MEDALSPLHVMEGDAENCATLAVRLGLASGLRVPVGVRDELDGPLTARLILVVTDVLLDDDNDIECERERVVLAEMWTEPL